MTIETTQHSAAQQRIIDAALPLFAEWGVSGTSLKDIADSLGVTKAAVYHQFPTKEEIVLAAVEEPLRDLARLVDLAMRVRTRAERLELFVDGLAEIVVRYRHSIGPIQGDPTMVRLIKEHPPYASVNEGLLQLLVGDAGDHGTRIRAVMAISALIATGASELVDEVDSDELRAHLREGARRVLDL